MWWLLTILFFLIGAFASILVYFALKRINQYEALIVEFQNIVEFSTQKMKQVDSKGHYESDDETNFFFQQLKQLQELFENDIGENKSVKEKTESKK